MHEEARHDAPVGHYDPPPDLKAYAHNRMLEREDVMEKFARQQWEAALGAVRVALGALREIYPGAASIFDGPECHALAESVRFLEDAHLHLNNLEDRLLGEAMVEVLRGAVKSVFEYRERYEITRDSLDDQA